MKDEIQLYCSGNRCIQERTFEYVGDTTKPTHKIYWCKTCGLIRIPRIKIKDITDKLK